MRCVCTVLGQDPSHGTELVAYPYALMGLGNGNAPFRSVATLSSRCTSWKISHTGNNDEGAFHPVDRK